MKIKILPPLPESVNAGKIPQWNLTKLIHRPCPVCNEDSPKPIVTRPDKLKVSICQNCNMIYLAEIPCLEDIEKFYSSYGEFKGVGEGIIKQNWLRIRKSAMTNFFIRILEATGGIKGHNVCDIGCSYGSFLELIKHQGGFAYGVEIDRNALESLKKRGYSVSAEVDLSRKYDIICMLQLLEHLPNPSRLLTKISNALHLDGRILISVPNAEEYFKIGYSWIGFRVDLEHLNYFTLHSLSELLINNNLIIEQYWEHNQPGVQRSKKNAAKLIRIIDKILIPIYIKQIGSFVLTVLARKI